jgi:phosphoribosyl 1,2-cyclic phosphodiesterase
MSKGFFTLVSGSSGNSSLLVTDNTKLLIDCGVSAKSIETHLFETGTDPSEIDAILVSHEHNDHICGIDVFARRYGMPVYVSSKFASTNTTRFAFMQSDKIERITYTSGMRFSIGDLDIFPFSVPHDVVENCAFRIETKDFTLAYATDIGHLTASLFDHFSLADYMLIESNYDPDLLKNGPYQYHLKQRIKGAKDIFQIMRHGVL